MHPGIPESSDQEIVLKILDRCSIRDIQSADQVSTCIDEYNMDKEPADLFGKDRPEDSVPLAVPLAIYQDMLCAQHDEKITQQERDGQRFEDIQVLLRIEQRKLFFRAAGIIGLGVVGMLL
jgi:hypothetical protein